MSQDHFTEVSRKSWFSRLKEAVKGIIIGLILFIAAFFLLFWNEGRAVKDYKTLKEGAGAVVSIPADQVDPAREGKLVHLTGKAVTEEILRDQDFRRGGQRHSSGTCRRNVSMAGAFREQDREEARRRGGDDHNLLLQQGVV